MQLVEMDESRIFVIFHAMIVYFAFSVSIRKFEKKMYKIVFSLLGRNLVFYSVQIVFRSHVYVLHSEMWRHSVMNSILFQCAEYSFEVFHVKNCPMSKESWETASTRLKCNSTHGYHCVPNKQFTSLIEFCYPKGPRFPFEAGIHTFTLNVFTVIFDFYLVCIEINCGMNKGIWKTRMKCNTHMTFQLYVQKRHQYHLYYLMHATVFIFLF